MHNIRGNMRIIKALNFSSVSRPIASIRPYQYMISVENSIQMSDVVPIYTDGSCSNNGKPCAVSAIGLYFPTKVDM